MYFLRGGNMKVKGAYTEAVIFTEDIEETALNQVKKLCDQKAFKDIKIRIMPDVHAGVGCVIGFTAELKGKVVPNLIGVDIGCGVVSVRLGKIKTDFDELDNYIRHNIPSGFKINKIPLKIPEKLKIEIKKLSEKTGTNYERNLLSLGSLGSGNHFIEVGEDGSGAKWLMIHSGSRNFGLQIAQYHQRKAVKYCEKIVKELHWEIDKIKDKKERERLFGEYKHKIGEYEVEKSLAFVEGEDLEEYLHDMRIAQEYASLNRKLMAEKICKFFGVPMNDWFETVHNYINFEDRIIRKGAVSAKKGERLLIPFNMRDGGILAIGKGNPEWNFSAPHGAGRLMSRKKAKNSIDIKDFKKSMEGIYTTSVGMKTIDESPFAYKPFEDILEKVKESVEIVDMIKPIYNFKAA